jgi:hypothetical protein
MPLSQEDIDLYNRHMKLVNAVRPFTDNIRFEELHCSNACRYKYDNGDGRCQLFLVPLRTNRLDVDRRKLRYKGCISLCGDDM